MYSIDYLAHKDHVVVKPRLLKMRLLFFKLHSLLHKLKAIDYSNLERNKQWIGCSSLYAPLITGQVGWGVKP